jgi:hypothetical protein
MKKFLAMMLLVAGSGALVQQCVAQAAAQPGQAAPAGQAGQKKEIKNPAEYNAYVNAIQQTNPAQKAQLLEAFLQTYPQSVMKEDALELLMRAYGQAGDAQKSLDAANRLLQANPNNVPALAVLAYNYRTAAVQGGPNAQDSVAKALQYGQQGLQALQTMQKPDGMSDADFEKLKKQMGAILDGAAGYASLANKDYATAQKDLRDGLGLEEQPDVSDVYFLALSDLEAKPINPEGFWFVIKASQLAQAQGQQQILDYGKKKYLRYHGPDSDKDWDQLVSTVKASSAIMPPAGFTVSQYTPPSPAEQAADLVKKTKPADMSFAEWELVLSSGNQQAADTVWNGIKDKAVKLVAQVVTPGASSVQLAGSEDDIGANKADITLTMAKPIPARLMPKTGTQMAFQGTIQSYTPNPFMMTFSDGILLDAKGNPVSTGAPVHHPATTTHKKTQ